MFGDFIFRKRSLGEKAPIFEAEMEKNITVIYWNIDHPFYLDFIVPNSENHFYYTAIHYTYKTYKGRRLGKNAYCQICDYFLPLDVVNYTIISFSST